MLYFLRYGNAHIGLHRRIAYKVYTVNIKRHIRNRAEQCAEVCISIVKRGFIFMRGIRLRKHFLEYFTGSVYGRYRRAAGLLLQLFNFIRNSLKRIKAVIHTAVIIRNLVEKLIASVGVHRFAHKHCYIYVKVAHCRGYILQLGVNIRHFARGYRKRKSMLARVYPKKIRFLIAEGIISPGGAVFKFHPLGFLKGRLAVDFKTAVGNRP